MPPISTNDHCTVAASLNFKIKRESAYTRTIWKYKDADFNQFRNALSRKDFDACFANDDIDVACSEWFRIFMETA